MPDRPWKAEERRAAALLGGRRHPANTGGRVDVEGPTVIAQVKHRRTLSLGALEALAVEAAEVGRTRGKLGILVVKRRAGCGRPTTRMVVMTEAAWRLLGRDQFGAAPQAIAAP
jgi:hypothetical protein